MTAAPKAKGDKPAHAADHEHVGKISTRTTLFVLLGISIFLYATRLILLPFVLAGVLAYICTPLIEWLASRVRLPRTLFAVGVFLLILLFLSVLGKLGLPPLAGEIARVVTDFQGTVDALVRGAIGRDSITLLGQTMNAAEISRSAVSGIRNWIEQAGRLTDLTLWSFAWLFGGLLTLVLLFYFLVSGPQVARGLWWLVPPGHRPLIQHIWSRVDPLLKRYFLGVIAVVAYAALAAYVGLGLVLGIRHAVFLAMMTGILEMIPVIGPASAAVIAGLVAVRHATGIGPIIAYAIYATCLRLSIDQLIGPLALGTAARLHPALVIFCFLSGGILFGIVGIILSVPAVLALRTTLGILYDEPERLARAATPKGLASTADKGPI
jgi:predicted PurR-regulated permease PerM